jgi:hypothetical protein
VSYLGRRFPDHTGNAYLLLAFDGNSLEEVEKTAINWLNYVSEGSD